MSRAISIPPDAAARMRMLVTAKTKLQCARDEAPQEFVEWQFVEPREATDSSAADEKAAAAEPPSEPRPSNR